MKKPAATTLAISADYRQFVEELKARVISARISAARAITHEAILLYWDIGRRIVEKQEAHDWGDSVVELVAADLRRAFPRDRASVLPSHRKFLNSLFKNCYPPSPGATTSRSSRRSRPQRHASGICAPPPVSAGRAMSA